MAKIEAKCRFCQRFFEPVNGEKGLKFPLHKDEEGSMFACEGSGAYFVKAAVPGWEQIPKLLDSTALANVRNFDGSRANVFVMPSASTPLKSGPATVHDDIQARFEIFHADNPHIYEALLKFAREAKQSGLRKFAIRPIVERARWFVNVELKGVEAKDFKINNDFCSRYARLIMERNSDLAGFFELRILQAAKEDQQAEADEREEFWWNKD